MVVAFTVFKVFSPFRLVSGEFWKAHGCHQAVHSSDADVDAIVTSKDIFDLVCANTFVIIRKNLQDDPPDVLILFRPVGGLRMKVLVISAAVYPKNSTKGFDVVLEAQFMDGI